MPNDPDKRYIRLRQGGLFVDPGMDDKVKEKTYDFETIHDQQSTQSDVFNQIEGPQLCQAFLEG